MKPKVKTWLKQIESGMIATNTTKILHFIMRHDGCNIYQMRENLNISHQTLTAIISVLMDEGLVRASGEIEIDGSHYSKLFYLFDRLKQEEQIEQRRIEKFERMLLSMNEYLDKLDDIQEHLDKLKFQDLNQNQESHDTSRNEQPYQTSIQGLLF